MDEPSPGFHGFHGQCQKMSILIEKHRNLADLMTHSLPPASVAFLSRLLRQNGGNRHECLRNMFRLQKETEEIELSSRLQWKKPW